MCIYHAYTERYRKQDWCPQKCNSIGKMWDDREWLGDLSSIKGEKTWKFRSNRHDHWGKNTWFYYISNFLNLRTKDFFVLLVLCFFYKIIFKYGKTLEFTVNIVVKPVIIIVKCFEDYMESYNITLF